MLLAGCQVGIQERIRKWKRLKFCVLGLISASGYRRAITKGSLPPNLIRNRLAQGSYLS